MAKRSYLLIEVKSQLIQKQEMTAAPKQNYFSGGTESLAIPDTFRESGRKIRTLT